MAYAEKTTVAPAASRTEIERTLTRYGADSFAYGSDAQQAVVGFRAHERSVRFTITQPDASERRFTRSQTGRARTPKQAQAAYEQEIRRVWRALALMVKAKLEAVSSGVATFEEEFLPYTVLPNGSTVAEQLGGQISEAIATGSMPTGIAGLLGPGD